EEGTTGPAVTNVTDGDDLVYSYGPPDHSLENASYTLQVYVSVPGAVVTPPPEEEVPPAEANVTSVSITSPEDGVTLDARNVTVSVEVANFTLVEPTGQANAPGEGHLIYLL